MQNRIMLFFMVLFVCGGAHALPSIDGAVVRSAKKSLLKPATFAKTYNDLSAEDHLAIMAEGYLPYESVYDASGRCIENCAYSGITLREEIERTQQATNQLEYDLCMEGGGTDSQCRRLVSDEEHEITSSDSDGTVIGVSGGADGVSGGSGGVSGDDMNSICNAFRSPLDGRPLLLSSIVGQRSGAGGQSTYHRGVDVVGVDWKAPIYATYPGKVTVAKYAVDFGYYVVLQHEINGRKYYTRYGHMAESPSVNVGDKVGVGEKLGLVGNTGKVSTNSPQSPYAGTHLHYDMYTYDDDGAMKIVDILGTVQNWNTYNEGVAQKHKWLYQQSSVRCNWLGVEYKVNRGSSNVMIQECVKGGGDAEKCVKDKMTGCLGFY